MDDFDRLTSQDETLAYSQERLDAEWATLNAIREMLGIGLKGRIRPTYAEALDFGKELAPEMFDTDASLLGRDREPPLALEYRQRAEALSRRRGQPVTPLEALEEELESLHQLVDTGGDKSQIVKRIAQLEDIKPHFLPTPHTENRLILRDMYAAERNLPSPPVVGNRHKDFQLANGRAMRVRLLHPDAPEHATGADLIYEHHWGKKLTVRIAVVQYKIWNGQTLYLSQATSLASQMDKMKAAFCDTGLCELSKHSARTDAYRLPYCSPFVRPTDKLQYPESRLISSGLHLPVCVAMRTAEDTGRGGKKIERKTIRSESVTHKVFEEMLNANLLGSRWLSYDELEELYSKHGIIEPYERVVLQAQEFSPMDH